MILSQLVDLARFSQEPIVPRRLESIEHGLEPMHVGILPQQVQVARGLEITPAAGSGQSGFDLV